MKADNEREAAREFARFVAEVHASPLPEQHADRDIVMDAAVERYLREYLAGEKGREASTLEDYRSLHAKWFSPKIGRRVRCGEFHAGRRTGLLVPLELGQVARDVATPASNGPRQP